MVESLGSEVLDAQTGQAIDVSKAIASLRAKGADQFDPLGLHYLAVLAERTRNQRVGVKRILEDKLVRALAAFEQRFQQEQGARQPDTAQQEVRPRESLGNLTRYIAQLSSGSADGRLDVQVGSRVELKAVRNFRNTWSKLSANKQVAHALGQAPKNAGPINSHMLVLRSLSVMRDISPDYLNRFVCYVDTLLCLDQIETDKPTTARLAAEGKKIRKSKPRKKPSS